MYIVTPKSKRAKEWVNRNICVESWQWLGDSFIVDHHFIADIEQGMLAAGFTTKDVVTRHA